MNKFDQINIKIDNLFENKTINNNFKRKNFFIRLIKRYFLAILFVLKIHKRLINSGLLIAWFDEY